jgi:hypothetical protein
MPELVTQIAASARDGTSQRTRKVVALNPDDFPIDERSMPELLAFARAFAEKLVYYDDTNRPAGTWAGFFDRIGAASGGSGDGRDRLTYEQVAAFLARPDDFTDPVLRRPHFVLFLTLLKLFARAQHALNGVTGRHLDFYYNDVLRMTVKPAVPDRVFVLFKPAAGVDDAPVPAGTLLAAGRDAGGRDRSYRTERELVVNRATVAKVMSVFVHKEVIDLAGARARGLDSQEPGLPAMLRLALGDPGPGGPLPNYGTDGKPVDGPRLEKLAALVRFCTANLYLEVHELRKLVALKRRRDGAEADWLTINRILEGAGNERLGGPGRQRSLGSSRNFAANLETVLGAAPDLRDLPDEIKTVDDLYANIYLQEVPKAIGQKLFMKVADFKKMMELKRASDNDWHVVNTLLERAGRRKRRAAGSDVPAPADPTNFAENLNAAVGPVDFASVSCSDIDVYYNSIVDLEKYFFMSAEAFALMMATVKRAPEVGGTAQRPAAIGEWQVVDDILGEAYVQKVYAGRRARLKARFDAAGSGKPHDGFRDALVLALDDAPTSAVVPLLNRIADFISADDLAILKTADSELKKTRKLESVSSDLIFDILERAQRKRERLPRPVPIKEKWYNLYANPDARSDRVESIRVRQGDVARWKTFGRPAALAKGSAPPPETLGWAIASPLLALSVGRRQITLTLGFHGLGGAQNGKEVLAGDPFTLQLSTAKGWIEPKSVMLRAADHGATQAQFGLRAIPALVWLEITVTLPATEAAIAPLAGSDAIPGCPWPALRLRLRQRRDATDERFVIGYQDFRPLRLAQLRLSVAVGSYVSADGEGLWPLSLEGDGGVLDGSKPFEPFGSAPAVGASLAIGHPDLFHKPLRKLRFSLTWMGGPANLTTHYAGYALKPAELAAAVTLVQAGVGRTGLPAIKLFSGENASLAWSPECLPGATVAAGPYPVPDAPAPAPEVRSWPRYLQWQLSGSDFGHAAWPTLMAQKSTALAAAIANLAAGKNSGAIQAGDYQVAPPYTPKLKTLSLDFVASQDLTLTAYRTGPATDQIFHVHPFGYDEIAPPATGSDGVPFLPQYDQQGELYIGIADAWPGRTLSLLFQMADGSANPDVPKQPVAWSTLSAEGWRPLPGESLRDDSTNGLTASGIVELVLPETAANPRLPAGMSWLRASVAIGAAAVCDCVDIHAQAVPAGFIDDGNGADHYTTPLPAGAITGPAESLPGIAACRQPYPSFGAEAVEDKAARHRRIAERLRHKRRAVTPWDYERLVLDYFPEVYKVKCLPAGEAARSGHPGAARSGHPGAARSGHPGVVRLIVIPDIRHTTTFDPFEPKASSDLHRRIAARLTALAPPGARIEVGNPTYVQVRIRLGVGFRGDNDEFNRKRLNDALNRYLSPWAYDDGADIVINRSLFANSIVAFAAQQPYVDFVAAVNLFSSRDGHTFSLTPSSDAGGGGGDCVSDPGADTVLVAASQHVIDIISGDTFNAQDFQGVGYMRIGLDFIVS